MANLQGVGAAFDAPYTPDSQTLKSYTISDLDGRPNDESETSSQTSFSLSGSPPAVFATHDTSRAHHHMRDLDRFVQDLNLAATRAFPNGNFHYKDVRVLLIRWEFDALKVQPELRELQSIFRDCYNFNTEVYHIPSHRSHFKLNQKILQFVDGFEDEENLLIVYYGGHGLTNKARQQTWMCDRNPAHGTVEWSSIQTCLEKAECDVLLLLDCCAAASALPLTERPTHMKETIAACGFETSAPSPGPWSFTSALIEVLRDLVQTPAFTASMLHMEILARIKHDRPRLTNGCQFESRRTPVYVALAPGPHTSSIILGRLSDNEDEDSGSGSGSDNDDYDDGVPPRTLSDRLQADGPMPELKRIETLTAVGERGQRKHPHVLLSLMLKEDQQLDGGSARQWLRRCPLLVKHATVEAVYRSYSTLVLLSVPVVLWNLLPNRLGLSFVGYVQSQNLMSLPPTPPSPPTTASGEVTKAVTPIPILSQGDGRGRDGSNASVGGGGVTSSGDLDLTSHKSMPDLGSLDSGYESSSVPGSLVASLLGRKLQDVILPMPALQGLRRSKSDACEYYTGQLPKQRGSGQGPYRYFSPLGTNISAPAPSCCPEDTRPNRLIVSVIDAHIDGPRPGLACVLWYGYEVQSSQAVKGATPRPRWDKEFQFNVQKSPMFYHLRLSVWGADMSELVGEVQIDLVSVVQRGTLPKMGHRQRLRSEGKETGDICVLLNYLEATVAEGKGGDREARIQHDEYHVW